MQKLNIEIVQRLPSLFKKEFLSQSAQSLSLKLCLFSLQVCFIQNEAVTIIYFLNLPQNNCKIFQINCNNL